MQFRRDKARAFEQLLQFAATETTCAMHPLVMIRTEPLKGRNIDEQQAAGHQAPIRLVHRPCGIDVAMIKNIGTDDRAKAVVVKRQRFDAANQNRRAALGARPDRDRLKALDADSCALRGQRAQCAQQSP